MEKFSWTDRVRRKEVLKESRRRGIYINNKKEVPSERRY
jgi:hypothetical protein